MMLHAVVYLLRKYIFIGIVISISALFHLLFPHKHSLCFIHIHIKERNTG